MKFRLIENPTFTSDVPVQVPTEQGQVEQTLKVRFNVRSLSELEAFEPLGLSERQSAFLDNVVVGFEDVVDGDGKPILVTPVIHRQLLDLPYIRNAILRDYALLIAGQKTKN